MNSLSILQYFPIKKFSSMHIAAKLLLVMPFVSVLCSCSAVDDGIPWSEFDLNSDFSTMCYYESFDGSYSRVSIQEIKKDCDCQVSANHSEIGYRYSAVFIDKNGRMAHLELSNRDVSYLGTHDQWRNHGSVCFDKSKIRISSARKIEIYP